jgi:anti-sigma regulatory factor (Ser/Thr protein kinase)
LRLGCVSSLLDVELVPDVEAPRVARRLLTGWLTATLEPDQVETATLLVSELVSNAVRHGEGKVRLQVDLDDDRLLVEVIDEGGGLEEVIREREFENVEGWGLRIVDRSASRWGAHEGTTHVWFELERAGPRLGPEKNPVSEDGGPSGG